MEIMDLIRLIFHYFFNIDISELCYSSCLAEKDSVFLRFFPIQGKRVQDSSFRS